MTTVTSTDFGDIEFFDDLPSKSIVDREGAPFADILRAHPQKWAAWPIDDELRTLHNRAMQIRNGSAHFKKDEFEAAIRGGVLYVRYIGESQ